jgi:pimeloyl-ACP methyl ester carboxylesterase
MEEMTAEPMQLALLPGLLCDAELWRPQIEGLSDIAECHVADFKSQQTVGEMAATVLDQMPGTFCMAGLSMGGYVALEIMRRAPERVQRLALLDTTARADSAEQTRRRRGLIQLAEKGDFKGVTPRLLPMLIAERFLENDKLKSVIMGMAGRIGRDGFLNQQKAIMTRPDSLQELAGIKVPTLVLCGRDDVLTPPDRHEEMAAAIMDADLVVLGGCGHLSSLERPADVTAALRRWLLR